MRPHHIAIALLAFVISAPSMALTEDREKPVEINAQRFDGDEVKQTAVYTGAVEVHQGTFELLCDKLTLTVSPDGYRTLTATGSPVRIKEKRDPDPKNPGVDEWMHAAGLTAIYDERKDQITLIDRAKIARSENGLVKDSSSGSRIVYDMRSARSSVTAGTQNGVSGRVSTILAPRQNKKNAAEPIASKPSAPMNSSLRIK